MATYVPSAAQLTEPTSSRMVGSAAEEFRVLKASLDTRADALEASSASASTSLATLTANVGTLTTQVAGLSSSQSTPATQPSYNIFDVLTTEEIADVRARTHLYDLGAKIQAYSDSIYLSGGGVLRFPVGDYLHSQELWIKQTVVWQGEFAGFTSPYSHPLGAPRGSALFKKSASNTNGVTIMCDLAYSAGMYTDVGLGTRNEVARHCGGIRDMTLWGNRSLQPDPTQKDLNSTGHGLIAKAARNIVIDNVTIMYYAERGLFTTTHDYGNGPVGVNSSKINYVTCMQNGAAGAYIDIGDTTILELNLGYNGDNGLTTNCGNTNIIGGRSWNNKKHGAYLGSNNDTSVSSVVGMLFYDNDACGVVIDGTGRVPHLIGCSSRGNGRDPTTYPDAWNRANYLLGGGAQRWGIKSCHASATDQALVNTAAWNFYISNSYEGEFTDPSSDGLALNGDIFVLSPGLCNVPKYLSASPVYGGWDTRTTAPAGLLALGSIHNITMNAASATAITDITYSGVGYPELNIRNIAATAVTITHNTSKIRCNSGADVVLSTYQAARFVAVNSPATVFQQV